MYKIIIIIISVRSYFIRRKLHHKWIIRYCYTYLYSFMCMGALWYMVYGIYIIYKLDIIIYNKYIITYIYIISVYHVHAWYLKNKKRVLFFMRLELLAILSHHIDAGNQIWVLWKSCIMPIIVNHLSIPYSSFS